MKESDEKKDSRNSKIYIVTAALLFLGLWEISVKSGLAHPVLVPPPENVLMVFVKYWKDMAFSVYSSMKLLVIGMGLGLVLGIFLGLFTGYVKILRLTIKPVARVVSTVPPLVYTPYVVAVMPTFYSASIFVIWSAVFWPSFLSMINRVGSLDRKIIDSARVMNLNAFEMIFKVILPYCMPDVIGRLATSLTSSMLCLTGAEMLGAKAGLGYFVKKYSDYADYTKVLAGIILIAVVTSLLDAGLFKLKRKLIKWEY